MIQSSIEIILLFGLVGAFTNWIAQSRGFYTLHPVLAPPISLKQVVGVFAIYLGIMLIASFYAMRVLIFLSRPSAPPVSMINIVQVLLFASIAISLFLFCRQDSSTMKKIWKNRALPQSQPIYYDFALGIATWFIGFPLVVVVGQFFDLLTYLVFGIENYEQVAVRYLKSTLSSPSQLLLALFTILIVAPIIEEFLFRGCLQTYFKRHFGSKAAILLSSLCFALFHFSSSQGIGNLSLIVSLFVFALFLGFIYERQGSLFASIGLHMTFNFASALRILLSPEV